MIWGECQGGVDIKGLWSFFTSLTFTLKKAQHTGRAGISPSPHIYINNLASPDIPTTIKGFTAREKSSINFMEILNAQVSAHDNLNRLWIS